MELAMASWTDAHSAPMYANCAFRSMKSNMEAPDQVIGICPECHRDNPESS